MSYTFTDKNGLAIMPGMTIRHSDGEEQVIYRTTDAYGNESLGIMATNPAFLKNHPDWDIEYYDLRQFDLSEWEVVTMTYPELVSKFYAHESNRNVKDHLTAHIVFTADSFTKEYSVESRTYIVSSNNKAYIPGMGGYSIYGSCLDGTDPCVRLEGYMAAEKGGKDGWKVEYCYLVAGEE